MSMVAKHGLHDEVYSDRLVLDQDGQHEVHLQMYTQCDTVDQ